VRLLLREDVLPYMSQVALDDPAAADYPIPETDDEVFVTETCVAVATRPDWMDGDLGDLPVEVWLSDGEDTLPEGEMIHDGHSAFSTDQARVGNYLAADTHDVALDAGRYRIRVLREPTGGPAETVRFILSRA
jgi:hypothetical protein